MFSKTVLALAALAVVVVVARESRHSIHTFMPQDWVLVGDAAIHDTFVRLVPDRQSRKGSLWNLNPVNFENWEVIYETRVHGVSLLGADGLAFWYVREPAVPGDLYGSKELFEGLALILDTYDNDRTGVHPYLFGLYNDGSYKFDHTAHDHKDHTAAAHGHDASQNLGEQNGCTIRLRNLRYPTAIKVRYINKKLEVLYSLQPGSAWTQCFTIDHITLPAGYYLGWSAATGDLADDHDVMNITVIDPYDTAASYLPPAAVAAPGAPAAAFPAPATDAVADIKNSLDRTSRQLQAKMDGLLDVVSDTLKSAGRQTQDTGALTTTVRNIQSQTSAISQMASTINEVHALVKQVAEGKAAKSSSGGLGFFSIGLILGLAGTCGFLMFQLNKERRSKKLF